MANFELIGRSVSRRSPMTCLGRSPSDNDRRPIDRCIASFCPSIGIVPQLMLQSTVLPSTRSMHYNYHHLTINHQTNHQVKASTHHYESVKLHSVVGLLTGRTNANATKLGPGFGEQLCQDTQETEGNAATRPRAEGHLRTCACGSLCVCRCVCGVCGVCYTDRHTKECTVTHKLTIN